MDKQSLDDLAKSGLVAEDIGARQAGSPEFAAIKASMMSRGYVIPYYGIKGERLPFYRVKLFDQDLKYKQPAGTSNHVYFPKNIHTLLTSLKESNNLKYILITEGEKKAACAVKHGFPCVALGGVDSFKNRTLILPADSEINPNYKEQKSLKIKLPAGEDISEELTVAYGLDELVNFAVDHDIPIIIVYDTDTPEGVKFEMQRAAANLGFQFMYMGMPSNRIKQITLPYKEVYKGKVGLDDFLMYDKAESLIELLAPVLNDENAFPRHPNIRAFINSKLQQGKMTRREIQEISLSVIADLDAKGRRLRDINERSPYFYDNTTYTLMKASLLNKGGEPMHESVFGTYLYRTYGLSAADTKIISWLAAQYTGEEPIQDVTPRKTLTLSNDCIAYQLSNSHFIIISGDEENPYEILTNGSKGILFEQGLVNNVDEKELDTVLKANINLPLDFLWKDIFKSAVNFNGDERGTTLAALLYYISPWIRRWKGTQLPVELIIGEPGSGKSSLYELRLGILTGTPTLRNMPDDLKDWYSSITSVGGLHVIDNVAFTNKEMRQRISDEICRITTEPDPHIELRRLYTTSEVYRMPVTTIFAMTAIQMPFHNADIIQRSAVFKLSAVNAGHDANWVQNQLGKCGGRIGWLAHHIIALHRFLKLSKSSWDSSYKSNHRLANYEQSLVLMAQVFGIESDWIPKELTQRMQSSMTETDWVLEGLKEFAEYKLREFPGGCITDANTISNWAMSSEDYMDNQTLTNSRSIGRYLQSHKAIVEKIIGMKEQGTRANKKIFYISPKKTS